VLATRARRLVTRFLWRYKYFFSENRACINFRAFSLLGTLPEGSGIHIFVLKRSAWFSCGNNEPHFIINRFSSTERRTQEQYPFVSLYSFPCKEINFNKSSVPLRWEIGDRFCNRRKGGNLMRVGRVGVVGGLIPSVLWQTLSAWHSCGIVSSLQLRTKVTVSSLPPTTWPCSLVTCCRHQDSQCQMLKSRCVSSKCSSNMSLHPGRYSNLKDK
jgi:hypothetical protein